MAAEELDGNMGSKAKCNALEHELEQRALEPVNFHYGYSASHFRTF